MKNKLLIVIPVFNCEKFLKKNINTYKKILELKDVDLLYVNDGSKDNTEKLLKIYKNQFKNIDFISKENGGLYSARLSGLKHFKRRKEYTHFIFIDGDDYIISENLEKMWKDSKGGENDIMHLGVWTGIPKFNWNKDGYCFAPSATARIVPRVYLKDYLIDLPNFKYEDGPITHVLNIKYQNKISKHLIPIFVYNDENLESITRVKNPTYLRDIFVSLDWTFKRFKEEKLDMTKCAYIFWEEFLNHLYRVSKAKSYNFKKEYQFSIKNIRFYFTKKQIKIAFKNLSFKKKILIRILNWKLFTIAKLIFKMV